jgi:hypothetical protein
MAGQTPNSKPHSSKNKKPDSKEERVHSQSSKHSKPLHQSANDTIDANSQANQKVNVKQSLAGKQMMNGPGGQGVRASISKEVSTT